MHWATKPNAITPEENHDMPIEHTPRIDELVRQVIILTEQVRYLAADLVTAKAEINRISKEQDDTQDLLNKGQGAVWVLGALGAIIGILFAWGKDILRPWVHL